jgi:TPR repeat protein
VKADPIQAETILRTLVDQGHQAALLNLGTILIREHQDTKGAIELWEKAGKSGNPYGYLEIGKVYLAGRGVEKDPKLAFPYIEKAAHGNIPEAQFILGELLRHGYGPSQTAEREQGFQWIEKAAAKGMIYL